MTGKQQRKTARKRKKPPKQKAKPIIYCPKCGRGTSQSGDCTACAKGNG